MKSTMSGLCLLLLSFACFGQAASPAPAAPAVPQGADGIDLVAIHAAGDTFTMGDGTFGPGLKETLKSDFYMSKFPVTNAQFGAFVSGGGYQAQDWWTDHGWEWKARKSQPANWNDRSFNAPQQPVVGVSWYEAVAFCNWLSAQEGLVPAYDKSGRADPSATGYRLPTEVEWEYAAAKGEPGASQRVYPWGDTWDASLAVSSVRPARASRTAVVGSRSPQGDTPQGLADMAGNVWEWCSDNYEGNETMSSADASDRYYFKGDSMGQPFVLRGGAWVIDWPNAMRTSFRKFSSPPGYRYNVFGFRVVRR
ncbi:MAG TPA: SUMF1/EgtB/PvdO family nonheme iron enzyme [Spirochaetia bacterium]|nr:SUMF1/EgtB/PvdO family nonheme iron enzyme [Spirochaetia bacterium]